MKRMDCLEEEKLTVNAMKTTLRSAALTAGALVLAAKAETAFPQGEKGKDLGAGREVLWDMDRIAELGGGAMLKLHHPELREVALVHDAPWEGNVCCYHTVLRDGGLYRMYYRGASSGMTDRPNHQVVCYAESEDGIVWRKPALGLCEYGGSKENNIILLDDATDVAHNFTPFLDANPQCPPDERYKAVAGRADKKGLIGYASADGLRWRRISDAPLLDKRHGDFDSQNLCFWDAARGAYALYFRKFAMGRRKIRFATSPDFRNWSGIQWLEFDEGSPDVELYTNSILPYEGSEGVYVGLPMRFCAGRRVPWDLADSRFPGVTDGVFMCGRGGLRFRLWGEAFLRPGLQGERWLNRNNMTAWGMVRTKAAIPGCPDELSLYSTENYYSKDPDRLRRMTVRMDGFVSVNAPWGGGSATTKPLTFAAAAGGGATRLLVNASTSGSGFIKCEVRDANGAPVPGFSLAESVEAYGDGIELAMKWKGGGDLSALAGEAVVLHFELKDADLYSYRFGGETM